MLPFAILPLNLYLTMPVGQTKNKELFFFQLFQTKNYMCCLCEQAAAHNTTVRKEQCLVISADESFNKHIVNACFIQQYTNSGDISVSAKDFSLYSYHAHILALLSSFELQNCGSILRLSKKVTGRENIEVSNETISAIMLNPKFLKSQ